MPGRTEACSSSSVRPTSRPAVRMPASCSGVLPSQRSRLNRPMRKTLPASSPHPLIDGSRWRRHAGLRRPRSNFCVAPEVPRPVVHSRPVGMARSFAGRHGGRMDERLAMVAAAQAGVLSTTDAARVGVRGAARRQVRAGELVSGPAGCLSPAHRARGGRPRGALRPAGQSHPRTRPDLDAASHHAALLLADIATYDVDVAIVDLVSAVRATRVRSGLRTHPSDGIDVEVVDGWSRWVVPVALCQLAAGSGMRGRGRSIDAALHERRCTIEQLRSAARFRRASSRVRRTRLRTQRPACESVGETHSGRILRGPRVRGQSQQTSSGKVRSSWAGWTSWRTASSSSSTGW